MTDDDSKQKNIAVMGETLGAQYTELCNEFIILNLYWQEFQQLFGTNEKRVERLNQAAPGFFHMLQAQLFESNMLHLARMTDRPKSMGKLNLSVCALPGLVADPDLKETLNGLIDEVERKTEFCRDWRNGHLAHRDLMLALRDERATPLATATRESFSDALKTISKLLNSIEIFYHDNIWGFEEVIPHRGVQSLLSVLGFGVWARDRRNENVAKGDFESVPRPESI